MTKPTDIRTTLTVRLAALEDREQRLRRDITAPMNADSEEQAVDIEDDEALLEQETLVAQRIIAVRAAIRRVDEQRYGQCLACGDEIPEARLAAIPEAAHCITCAEAVSAPA